MSVINTYNVKSGTTIADAQVGCVVKLSDAREVDLATAATDAPLGIVTSVNDDGTVGVEVANGAEVFVRLGAAYTAGTSADFLAAAADSRLDPFSEAGDSFVVCRMVGLDDYADGDLAPAILCISLNNNGA